MSLCLNERHSDAAGVYDAISVGCVISLILCNKSASCRNWALTSKSLCGSLIESLLATERQRKSGYGSSK